MVRLCLKLKKKNKKAKVGGEELDQRGWGRMCGLSGNHLQSRLFYLEHFYKFGDDGGFRGTLKMGGWRQLVWGGTQGRTLLHGCHHTSHNSKTIMKLRRPGRVGGSQEPWVNASRAGGSEECILPHSAQVPGPGPGPGGAGIS